MNTEKKYTKLGDIECYVKSFHLSNEIWSIVSNWEGFARNTLGSQFVRAVDSISANIAEGFGRYHKKDKIKFYYYARASVYECFDWNEKAKIRKLISEDDHRKILSKLQELPKSINKQIKYTSEKLKE